MMVAAGMRVIAPDLVGYGKSDKTATLAGKQPLHRHHFFRAGQDWGGLIGLRLVVNHADRFDRVAISNTGLPYNPDVPDAVVNDVEEFRANAPTPSLIEMQKANGGMGDGDPARKFACWPKFCWEIEPEQDSKVIIHLIRNT